LIYLHFFTARFFPFIIASVIFLYADFKILLNVAAETPIFFHHSAILSPSKLINLIDSISSQKISMVSLFGFAHCGPKHLTLGPKQTILSFFGLGILLSL